MSIVRGSRDKERETSQRVFSEEDEEEEKEEEEEKKEIGGPLSVGVRILFNLREPSLAIDYFTVHPSDEKTTTWRDQAR